MTTPSTKLSDLQLLPVSKLLWLVENEDVEATSQLEFVKKYFPDAEVKKVILEGNSLEEKRKKMTLIYQECATSQTLDQTGIICQSPQGFAQWDQFVDFLRADPPAFLWKLEKGVYNREKAILMPIDFSQGTDITLPIIRKLVELEKGKKIILVNLFEEGNEKRDQEALLTARNDKKQELKWYLEANFPAEVRKDLILDAIPIVGKDRARYLNDYLEEHDVELVVMGSRNFNHYHYLLYGSTIIDMLKKEPQAHLFVLF